MVENQQPTLMIKAILFDADGVVIAPHPYFSKRLQDEFGISSEKVLPFFKNEFKTCTIGKTDLKNEIAKYLPEWGWNKSLDEMLAIWFSGEKVVNEEILEIVDGLRLKGMKCYLASDNEKYRANYLVNEMGLEKHFDGMFFSCNLGCTKSEPQFYEKALAELKLQPDGVMYWDDDPKNIEVAKIKGMDARVYEGINSLRIELTKLFAS
jgi:putative hydrolase of the HAD superfamily